MSGKLDQSLDEILSTQRRSAPRGRRSARRASGKPATTAPVGGVQKTSKPARGNAAKPAPAKAGKATGESKVIVSNLVSAHFPVVHVSASVLTAANSPRTWPKFKSRYVTVEAVSALGTFIGVFHRIFHGQPIYILILRWMMKSTTSFGLSEYLSLLLGGNSRHACSLHNLKSSTSMLCATRDSA